MRRGELTRRAVPSGKLDLLRAEALLEVIHAALAIRSTGRGPGSVPDIEPAAARREVRDARELVEEWSVDVPPERDADSHARLAQGARPLADDVAIIGAQRVHELGRPRLADRRRQRPELGFGVRGKFAYVQVIRHVSFSHHLQNRWVFVGHESATCLM